MPARVPVPAAVCARRPLACAAAACKHTKPFIHQKCFENTMLASLKSCSCKAIPSGLALGYPALHAVAGSPLEQNDAERSTHRALPLAPHFQPETTQQRNTKYEPD